MRSGSIWKFLFIKLTLSGPHLEKRKQQKKIPSIVTFKLWVFIDIKVNRMYLGKYNKYNFFIGHKILLYIG